jgi:hypothetical protein
MNAGENRLFRAVCSMAAVVFVLFGLLVLLLRFLDGGVTNRMVDESVHGEASSIREAVNARADAIESKLDRLAGGDVVLDAKLSDVDAKLSRVESKLDALLKLADRPLPDGMKKAE